MLSKTADSEVGRYKMGNIAKPTMLTFQCPTCQKPFAVETREDAPFRPFCSNRCKMIDLDKWFEGEYRISDPIPPHSSPDDSTSPQAGPID